jgi:hypothetical protein
LELLVQPVDKKQREFYKPKGLEVLEGKNRGYNEAITLLAAVILMTLDPKKSSASFS